jgi:hypothetical protein
MALFGLASIVAGIVLIGVSVWLWAHIYTGLIVETWGSELLGRAAVAVWLTPTLLQETARDRSLASKDRLVSSRVEIQCLP